MEARVAERSTFLAEAGLDTDAADLEVPAALEPDVSEALERLNERVDALSAELLAASATEARPLTAIVDRIAFSQDELREAHAEISRQLDELSQRLVEGQASGDGVQEAPVADDLVAALFQRVEEISGRLDALNQRVGENPDMTITHLRAIEARLHQLEATPAPRDDEDQLRRLEEITERLGRLEEQYADRADTEQQRVTTLEGRIEETVERLVGRGELQAALETPTEQIGVALERAGQATADAARIAAENEDLRRRSDQFAARLDQLQATIDEERARATSESATLGQAHHELAGTFARLTERVESLADQAAGAGGNQERLESLDRRVDEAVARLNEIVESQRQQLEAGLRDGLAAVALDRQESVTDAARIAAENEDLRRRSDQVVARLLQLQATIDEERARTKSESATLGQAHHELAGTFARLTERVESLAEQAAGAAGQEALESLNHRVDGALTRLNDMVESQRQQLEADMREGLAAVALDREESVADAAHIAAEVAARLDQLQATIDEERARTRSESTTRGQAHEELAGTFARLTERVESLADQAAGAGDAQERLEALDRRVDEALARLNEIVESRRQLPGGAGAETSPAAEDIVGRVGALEHQAQQSRDEVSELSELHAALDAGLGALRAELGDVRAAVSRVADGQADMDDRLEASMRVQLVPEGERGKGRRAARKAAESALSTVSAAVQDLLREHRQLRDEVDALQRASNAATAAAARAASQASSLGPIRSEMKLLHQEIAEHNDVLEALRKSVEGLRRPPPAARPPAKKAPPAKAPAPAKAAPLAKAAAARAAIARAAAAQTAAARAPAAAKRAPRAKKA